MMNAESLRSLIQDDRELWTLQSEPSDYRKILAWADHYNFLEEAKDDIRNADPQQHGKKWAFEEVLDRCRDCWRESILSVDERKIITVLVATGGPAYGYDFECDQDGEVLQARFWFQDWFEPKTYLYTLEDDQADAMASRLALTEFYY